MSDFSMQELEFWNEKIECLISKEGLNTYQQEFEICSYEEMIGYEAYTGMPTHYPHWSYGKSYERIKTLHKYNLSGLPYEMVINSNPCIAYLMKDNTLLLQILTMAHVYGHNDFFKNNRLFKEATWAENTIEKFKNQANRMRGYISDPGIGYGKVERILNAAHALKYQIARVFGEKKLSPEEQRKRIAKLFQSPKSDYPLLETKQGETGDEIPELKKLPPEPEEDILLFLIRYGRLEEWEKDIISMVREETLYFIPQIETKIMNEGWASYWHYKLLQQLELPQGLHLEFLKRHNQVIRPHEGSLNPYFIGFKIFEDLERRFGREKIFEVRALERDQSFIRRYLTRELCDVLNLFEYSRWGDHYVISEVSDEEGWETVRDTLAQSVGMGGIPVIEVIEWVQADNMLILEHKYDGRELDLNNAYETIRHLENLWQGKVLLSTVLDGKKKLIICDENRKVILADGV